VPHTAGSLLDLGLIYDSSLMGNDYSPYYVRRGYEIPQGAPMRFGEKTRLVEMPVSWLLDDYPHFEHLRLPNAIMPGLKTPEEVFRNGTEDIAYMVRDFTDGVLVFTFHPQVIGRGHRMLGLERWLDELTGMDVAFERLESVAEQFLEGRHYGGYKPRRGRPR